MSADASPQAKAELLEVLVIDSGAIIRGAGTNFHLRASRFVTVTEVIAEIRDSKSRDLLASLPYELEMRHPSEESMQAVAAFAKKSGDFAALSLTDLKLIALTYTIEKETTGGASIRTEPRHNNLMQKLSSSDKRKGSAKAKPKAIPEGEVVDSVISSLSDTCGCGREDADPTHDHGNNDEPELESTRDLLEDAELEYDIEEEEDEDGDGEEEEKPEEEKSLVESDSDTATKVGVVEQPSPDLNEEDFPTLGTMSISLSKSATAASSSWASIAMTGDSTEFVKPQKKRADPSKSILRATPAVAAPEDIAPSRTQVHPPSGVVMPSRILAGNANGHSAMASLKAALEDDGEGWINSSNIKSRALEDCFRSESGRKKAGQVDELQEEIKPRVACITTDFSMQNVMMQMGLSIVSVDGLIVKTVKQWVLRCMACYKIHYQMDRLFCEKCGANHLSRVSCSIDNDSGRLKLHLKKGYQPNTRGKIYSLPKPGQQGRYEGELLLRADQLETGIWKQKAMKIQRDMKSAFGDDVTHDVGVHVNKGGKIRVGLGKQNPNAAKGRERRGKPKTSR